MRSMVVSALGGPEVLCLEEGPSPALEPESVRIDVYAAGVNFADSLLLRGRYQVRRGHPSSRPRDRWRCAGDRCRSPGSHRWRARTRRHALRGFADEVVMPEENTYPLPVGMDFTTGAAFPVAYGTAHGALSWKAALAAGETCLVLGRPAVWGWRAWKLPRRWVRRSSRPPAMMRSWQSAANTARRQASITGPTGCGHGCPGPGARRRRCGAGHRGRRCRRRCPTATCVGRQDGDRGVYRRTDSDISRQPIAPAERCGSRSLLG